MIIKSITLNNIGPYEGKNILDFNTKDNKNTILIGGKNGSGKTTFLNSVRLALYGPLAYGFKTVSKDYIKKVQSLLNSNSLKKQYDDIKDHEEQFSIRIDFSIIQDFTRNNVAIIRSWDVDPFPVKEKVSVIKNGIEVSEVEKDKFFSHLRTSFPPSLLELCFFDGEEISHLTDEDHLSHYLQILSSKIFNLDLFQNLESDLNDYLDQSSKSKEQSKLEEEKNSVEEELKRAIRVLEELKTDEESTINELEYNQVRYKEVKNDFAVHGGLAYEERDKIQNRINDIEGDRKHLNEKIKEFIAMELPFFLAYPKLSELVKQLKEEEDFHVSNVLKEKIQHLPTDELVKNIGLNTNDEQEAALKDSLVKYLVSTEEVDIVHNASKTEAQQVYSLLQNTNLERLQMIIRSIEENQELLNELQELRQKLRDNDDSPEFSEMIESMEVFNHKVSELEINLSTIKEEIHEIQNEIDESNRKYEKIKQQLHNIQKTKSSFEQSQKVIQISKKFQKQQLRNKIKDIEYFSTKMFKDLIRKKEFIKYIKINPEDFTLTILDFNNEEINKDILSAGEKELLALSIIWGTIMSSKKELPLILDTLLGRLDNEHKHSIVTKLLPKFGVQNIVLSTDSEIDQKLYEGIKDTTANEYTLNYDSSLRKTKIEHHFFNLVPRKVNLS
ncbi:DNA sulfur modification protein DndD [Halobacillus faecis]|uniref:Nuclease SbcCD subunit C n=1 Tax=Halobacillus faecis TaxID=360184 RepID=A0A511WMW9_9BACI|nr:DNA sulfur modification protein DndD [Halobacillus faecis]GEN52415.1 hypothetical protein HFA01_06770 [Halobacillus faecis]